jgi:hypothetical protein
VSRSAARWQSLRSQPVRGANLSTALVHAVPEHFAEYFSASLGELTDREDGYHRSVERAAITLGGVLAYLSGCIAPQTASTLAAE